MTPQQNRKLHALAGEIAPKSEAHEILKNLAYELFQKSSLSDVTESEARQIGSKLKETKEKMRRQIYQSINSGAGPMISDEQLGYARTLKRLLGWSNAYFETFINQRYQEPKLELMPAWKAVRMVSELQRRWHSKKKQQEHHTNNKPQLLTQPHQGGTNGRQQDPCSQ